MTAENRYSETARREHLTAEYLRMHGQIERGIIYARNQVLQAHLEQGRFFDPAGFRVFGFDASLHNPDEINDPENTGDVTVFFDPKKIIREQRKVLNKSGQPRTKLIYVPEHAHVFANRTGAVVDLELLPYKDEMPSWAHMKVQVAINNELGSQRDVATITSANNTVSVAAQYIDVDMAVRAAYLKAAQISKLAEQMVGNGFHYRVEGSSEPFGKTVLPLYVHAQGTA